MIEGCPHGPRYITGENCSECQREALTAAQQLINIAEMLDEAEMAMTDEEIRAECIADGIDPERQAEETRAMLRRLVSSTTTNRG